ncbi:MAG TPA: tetratricopeptide repeat protein [Rhodanobacteraceae bacterium]
MTLRFLIIAAVMVVVALACALVPMLRSARREGRPRAPFWIALALVLLMPPVVLGSYLKLGTPRALQPPPADTPADLAKATQQLRQSLAGKPDDAQGWALLSQAYSAMNEPQQALDALNHVLQLKPNDPDAMVAWAEASAESDPDHTISDAARAKLKHALQINPTHQRALWLMGVSDFQRGEYANATKRWTTLLPLLPKGSSVAAAVQKELADAKARGGANAAPASPAAGALPAAPHAAAAVALNITVRLDPKLAAKVTPGDTVYVFARAVNGPVMPLAVAKLSAASLPAKVTLSDAMAMTPGLTLSKYDTVDVAARISSSGDPMPHAGDLAATPVQVATDSHKPIALTIDKVE